MDSPSFVAVSSSPDHLYPSPLSTPPRTATSTPLLTPDDCESSDSTDIVTIYSMYEEDSGSWSAPPPTVGHRFRPSKDHDIDVTVLGVDAPQATAKWGERPLEDSAYFETDDWQRSSMLDKPRDSGEPDGFSRPPSSDPRIPRTSQSDNQRLSVPRVLSNCSSLSTSTDSRISAGYEHESKYSDALSNFTTSSSSASTGLPKSPRPQTLGSLSDDDTPRASSSSTVQPQEKASITTASQPSLSSPPAPSQPLLTPASSPPRLSTATSSPSSAPSIAPLPGEDADGFHVRSTYAQLETCGVRGDGIEEGVERTRARVGGSRASELAALHALGDETEKKRELTAQEVEMLASLDRYGFYVTPSHDRIILLPAAPLRQPFTRLTTANTSGPSSAPLLPSLPPVLPPQKELSRVAKWGRMLEARSRDTGRNIDSWAIKPSKEHKLRERTFKGIPDRWRTAAWDTLLCRFSKHGKAETKRLTDQYFEALDLPSTYDVQIDLDVPRTISGHVMFRTRYGQGQRSLFHVLHSFSLHCETCGYCQGMGPIAATLLCYFEPERVYASLVRLHDAYHMHTIFSPGFPGLLESIYVQERIMEEMLPAVYAAFKKHMVSTTSYATKWYITLFANSVPFQTQLRLWDAFLLEGYDIFVVVAVAIVWVYRDHITSSHASFETVLSLLSSFFVPEDENALLAWVEKVLSDKKLRSNMQQWRKDWQRLVASGEHNNALL